METSLIKDVEDNFSDLVESLNKNHSLDAENVQELLKTQLAECEFLQSMFPNANEFIVDHGILVDIENYICEKTSEKPPLLNYLINLDVSGHKLEVSVTLPTEYPNIQPDVFVRCKDLSRNGQMILNKNMSDYLLNLEKGEIIISMIIAWLQENALNYFNTLPFDPQFTDKTPKVVSQDQTFNRLWIYSHHIYSKEKRLEILNLAHRYHLTGFCLPGKPGILCIEGFKTDCDEFWQSMKSINWKKITCIRKEEMKIYSKINELRTFQDFRELAFDEGKVKKLDYHMDFGQFYKFLKENNCQYMFKEYFGMDGK